MVDDYPAADPLWLLSPQVSVVEAALLMLGIEPQGISQYVEGWGDEKKPESYLAARQAVVSAVQKEFVSGSINHPVFENMNGSIETDHLRYDYAESWVDLRELQIWLKERGYMSGFLYLPDQNQEGFRDPSHKRYSAKLAAAVEAWEKFDPNSTQRGTVKQRLTIWLRLNAARFGLTNEEGLPTETVIDDLAKVANWDTGGGAPKSSQCESEPDF